MPSHSWKNYIAKPQQALTLADAAIALGVPVFPCAADKRPLTEHGFKDASMDPAEIRRMFANPSAKMIGMPTGEVTNTVVVDVDVKDGAQGGAWLDANSHRMPQTRTIRTGSGGLHIYLLRSGVAIRNSASKIAPGIDVRGDGGYVIVAPSPGYVIADDAPVADIPDWLMPALLPQEAPRVVQPARTYHTDILQDGGTPYGLAALASECDAIRYAADGTKHATLNKAAFAIGGLVTAGELQESVAASELSSALSAIRYACKDFRAAERTLRNSFHQGMGKPRDVPDRLVEVDEVHPAAGLIAKMWAKVAQPTAKAMPVTPDLMDVDGVLRMLVDECARTAIRPQPFLSLGAAICAVGALAGRQYRTRTDLRTNIYIVAIAESGGGKDHAAEIVRRSIDAAGLERYLGGETLASGRAVLSSLEHHPAKLFQVDEFGLFLTGVTGKKAAPHKAEIWSELMKLYSRAKGIYRGTEYANKKENPRIDICQPCVSFYGTTTPSTFWSALEGGAMSDGSLARFLVFASDNNRPERNRDAGIFKAPDNLVAALQEITRGHAPPNGGNLPAPHTAPMLATQEAEPYTVPMTPSAVLLHDEGLEREDAWAKKVEGTPQASVVNRLGENAAKLALISAVSRCPSDPEISERDVAWAWALAEHCTRSLLQDADRFIADSEFEARLNKATNIIRKHGPCTLRDMYAKGFKLPERERREALDTLVSNGVIIAHQVKHDGPGRPTIRYTIAVMGDTPQEDTDGE